jgi:hypothetical protein
MTLPEDRPTEQLAVHALSPPWRPRRETCRDPSLPMTVVGSQARHIPTRPRGPRPGSSDGCRGDPAWESLSRRCNSSLATDILAEPSIDCLPLSSLSLPLATGGPSFLAPGQTPGHPPLVPRNAAGSAPVARDDSSTSAWITSRRSPIRRPSGAGKREAHDLLRWIDEPRRHQ